MRMKELGTPSVTDSESALQRCRASADLINAGQYDAAREALGELWPGVGERPDVKRLPPLTAAEVLLQCGALSGWLGSTRSVSGAQEKAQDLLFEALRKFQSQGRQAKVSEAQYELGMCYWRLGQYDEARVVMREALKPLADEDVELKAKLLIRLSAVEIWENRYYEALTILKEAEPVFKSANDALKGRWHGQMAIALVRLSLTEGNDEYSDRAIIEFTAAIYHYEQAGHERNCAANLNNLAMTLYKMGRYREAHENLDRAHAIYARLKDGTLAQVNETRARVLIAEKRYREAERVIEDVVAALEKIGEPAQFADALTLQGIVWARLCGFENSIQVLRRAMKVAQDSGASTQAGLAALTLIEEHGATRRLSDSELSKIYWRADELLKGTQDEEDVARLRACARLVVRRLSGLKLRDRNFSLYSAVHEFEARLIEQALDETGGSVTRAARLLGLKYQTLASLLKARHRELQKKRTPAKRRLRSIIKKVE